ALREMGETGKNIRTFRHYAILADITQGLGRQMVGKAIIGKTLFEGKAAAEVAAAIKASKTMHTLEGHTRKVFAACDGFFLPVISHGIYEMVQFKTGNTAEHIMPNSVNERGPGAVENPGHERRFDSVSPGDVKKETRDRLTQYAATLKIDLPADV